jgi:hypothetical protein
LVSWKSPNSLKFPYLQTACTIAQHEETHLPPFLVKLESRFETALTQIVIRSHVYRSGLALKLLAGATILDMTNRILDWLADDRFHFTGIFCMCNSASFNGKVGPLPTVSKK